MKTFVILSNSSETEFRFDTSAWPREIGDRMVVEGIPYKIVYLTTDYAQALFQWKRLCSAVDKKQRRLNRIADMKFAKAVYEAAKEVGMLDELLDAVKWAKSGL